MPIDWTIYKNEFVEVSNKTINWLTNEYNKLRAGRISHNVLDQVKIMAYNELMPINQVATIQLVDARQMLVKPFDKANAKSIADAINKVNLGANVNLQSDSSIRLNFPPLSEETRKASVKNAKSLLEDAKAQIRNIRQSIQTKYKKVVGISQDDLFYCESELNKITQTINNNLEKIYKDKEGELLSF